MIRNEIILLLLVLSLQGCQPDNAPAPFKFEAYRHNPILSPGIPGTWEELLADFPHIVLHNDSFYLFYTGFTKGNITSIGLATSTDGFNFRRFEGNPLLTSDRTGFDAYNNSASAVIIDDSAWVMYFNASELPGYGPGPFVGRAVSGGPYGSWVKYESPVMSVGSKGEWDAGFIFPNSVMKNKDGTYLMYFTAGRNFPDTGNCIGMATSSDGINWKKYNDPLTTRHPYAESDPVIKRGLGDDWDNTGIWTCSVFETTKGFAMYYVGERYTKGGEETELGFATSEDGKQWIKFRNNPVFNTLKDYAQIRFMEFPSICFNDSVCFLYYDYGSFEGKIGVATASMEKMKLP